MSRFFLGRGRAAQRAPPYAWTHIEAHAMGICQTQKACRQPAERPRAYSSTEAPRTRTHNLRTPSPRKHGPQLADQRRGFGELGPSVVNVDMLLNSLLIVRSVLGSTAFRKLKEVNGNGKRGFWLPTQLTWTATSSASASAGLITASKKREGEERVPLATCCCS